MIRQKRKASVLNAPEREGKNSVPFEKGNPAYQSNSKVGSRNRVENKLAQYTWRNRGRAGLTEEAIEKRPIVGARGQYNRNNIESIRQVEGSENPATGVLQLRNVGVTKSKYKSKNAIEGAKLRNNWVIYVKLVKNIYSQYVKLESASKKFPELMADNLLQAMFHAKDRNGQDCPVPPTHYIVLANCDIRKAFENIEINVQSSIEDNIKNINMFDENAPVINQIPFNGINARQYLNQEFDQIAQTKFTDLSFIPGAHYWPYRYSDNSKNINVANGISSEEWYSNISSLQPTILPPRANRTNTTSPIPSIADEVINGFSPGFFNSPFPSVNTPSNLDLVSLRSANRVTISTPPALPAVQNEYENEGWSDLPELSPLTDIFRLQDQIPTLVNDNNSVLKSPQVQDLVNVLSNTSPSNLPAVVTPLLQQTITEVSTLLESTEKQSENDLENVKNIIELAPDIKTKSPIQKEIREVISEMVASVQNKLLSVEAKTPEAAQMQADLNQTPPSQINKLLNPSTLSNSKLTGLIQLAEEVQQKIEYYVYSSKFDQIYPHAPYFQWIYSQKSEWANRKPFISSPTQLSAIKESIPTNRGFTTPILRRPREKIKKIPAEHLETHLQHQAQINDLPIKKLEFEPTQPRVIDEIVYHPITTLLRDPNFWKQNKKGKYSADMGKFNYYWEKLENRDKQILAAKELMLGAFEKLSDNDTRSFFLHIRAQMSHHFQQIFEDICLALKSEFKGQWYAGVGFVSDFLRSQIERLIFPDTGTFEATIVRLFLLDDAAECNFFWRRVADRAVPPIYKEVAKKVEDEVRWKNHTWTSKLRPPTMPVETLSPEKIIPDRPKRRNRRQPPDSARLYSPTEFAPGSPAISLSDITTVKERSSIKRGYELEKKSSTVPLLKRPN